MKPTLITVLEEGYEAARAAAVKVAAGGAQPAQVATEATSVMVTMLADAGLLRTEPVRAVEPPSALDAAVTLSTLARHPRLTAEDAGELLEREELVDFAWGKVQVAGLDAVDLNDARIALGVLRRHHRGV